MESSNKSYQQAKYYSRKIINITNESSMLVQILEFFFESFGKSISLWTKNWQINPPHPKFMIIIVHLYSLSIL